MTTAPERPRTARRGPGRARIARAARAVAARVDPFLAMLVGVVALASVLPARGVVAEHLGSVVFGAVAFLFFLYGVRLPTAEAWAAVRAWRLHTAVLAVTYVVFPLLGLLAYLLAGPVLPQDLARGVLFLTLLPSTVQSSIAFTSIARGNVAGAVVSASLSNLLGIVMAPVLVALLMGGVLDVTGGALGRIAVQLLVPFVAGQLLRRHLVGLVTRRPALTRAADRGAILLVVYAAFSDAVTDGIWATVSVRDLLVITVLVSAVLAAALALTATAGRRLGFDRADRVVLLMCGSKKSLASGVPIAMVLLPPASLGVMLLPLMIFHQVQLLVGATLARRLASRAPDPVGRVGADPEARQKDHHREHPPRTDPPRRRGTPP
ncbi:bile acid:sodium symporter family protein [Cellulomonas bogoriensis]|uniref:Membrane protein n=1 Tax=Cellulomonas bogoriensis 69B4 = DSM 16987 TaxID=1386082 RepID=A0A0A0BLS1_9CELL|nr:bile acid:sodium symporter family protein [Cellulomonas bogoriensis]KGM08795.1 membrane protein [Cellulomonas bogoriensis 69B4 = DSM 16987]